MFYLAVNIPLFWIGAPIAALMSRRHPLIALTFYSVIFINALVHLVPLLAGVGYSPGTLTAAVLFVPVSIWVAFACFGKGRLSYKAMALLVADGVILHVILMGSIQLFIRGMIDSAALVWIQVGNAVLFLLIPWLGEKWRNGVLVKATFPGPAGERLSSRALGRAGILAHIFLGLAFVLLKFGVINGTGLLAYGVVLSFVPILFAAIKPDLLRPSPAQ